MTARHAALTAVLALSVLTVALSADVNAQDSKPRPSGNIPVVGFLHPGVPGPVVPLIAALRQGLHELGYIEGQNIRLEYRWGAASLRGCRASRRISFDSKSM
jgi:hypothetical protein